MKARALEIFYGVLRVFDNTAQAFVGVRYVVAAIEIIVDVHFPVAMKGVDAAIEIMKFFRELQRGDESRHGAKKIAQRRGVRVEIHEDEVFPRIDEDRDEAIVCAIEIADALELDHAFEGAVDAIGPAMIRTAELLRATLRIGDHCGGVMPANVVEGAQLRVIAADDHDRFAGEVGSEEFSFFANLIEAAGDLPCFAKYGGKLQCLNARVAVPGRGDGGGFLQRIGGIVQAQDFADALLHGNSLNIGKPGAGERI